MGSQIARNAMRRPLREPLGTQPVAISGERDQPAPMQAQWTPRLVQQTHVGQRLPNSGRPRGLVSFRPAAPVHSFTEMLHWTDARE